MNLLQIDFLIFDSDNLKGSEIKELRKKVLQKKKPGCIEQSG